MIVCVNGAVAVAVTTTLGGSAPLPTKSETGRTPVKPSAEIWLAILAGVRRHIERWEYTGSLG